MRWNIVFILCIGLMGLGASCAGDPKSQQAAATSDVAATSIGAKSHPRDGADASSAARTSSMPKIPAGARFTIFCGRVDTPDHVARANRLKGELLTASSLRDWYVVHEDGQTLVYHGFYKAIESADDPAEAARAKRDRELIDQLRVNNVRLFPRAIFVPLDSPDPDAPPEWNILNVDANKPDGDPTKAYWTLEIAVYTGHADRKSYAVDAVREARKMGIPAFYFHGPATSSVLIGAWPKSAVVVREVEEVNRDRDQVLFVSQTRLPPEARNMRDRDGKRIKVIEPEADIRDPNLRQTLERFPNFAVNGEEETVRVGEQMVPKPSLLRRIPRELAKSTVGSAGMTSGDQTVEPPIPMPQPPSNPRQPGGRLRSIGG